MVKWTHPTPTCGYTQHAKQTLCRDAQHTCTLVQIHTLVAVCWGTCRLSHYQLNHHMWRQHTYQGHCKHNNIAVKKAV